MLHQRREFAATDRATAKRTPRARNSRNIVLPRFHCMSWMARNRWRIHSSSVRQRLLDCASPHPGHGHGSSSQNRQCEFENRFRRYCSSPSPSFKLLVIYRWLWRRLCSVRAITSLTAPALAIQRRSPPITASTPTHLHSREPSSPSCTGWQLAASETHFRPLRVH